MWKYGIKLISFNRGGFEADWWVAINIENIGGKVSDSHGACSCIYRKPSSVSWNLYDTHDKHKFKRKVKQKKPDETLTEIPRTSRGTISARNFSEKCFFCDKLETCDTLHLCQHSTLYHRKCLVYFYHATATIISENRGKPWICKVSFIIV